jgi:formamidopyrimidine-DNA glycosylase
LGVPELPDITSYLDALEPRVLGQTLERIQILNPFLLRTALPPLDAAFGKRVIALRRIGKRIAIGLEDELWLVLHLMIAGRLHWASPGEKVKAGQKVATFLFSSGLLSLTEAGSKKRASLHLLRGDEALAAVDPGGVDVMTCDESQFSERLRAHNHTLKRALTDPKLFSGIGNAYSDEILHHAKLSPVQLTQKLTPAETARLFDSIRRVLQVWTERLRQETGTGFPENVTAFRPEMAVHGKFGKPGPVCGTTVQRIRYADNETNYCPACQTEGRLLADRSLSRLLKSDWPRTVEELEGRS